MGVAVLFILLFMAYGNDPVSGVMMPTKSGGMILNEGCVSGVSECTIPGSECQEGKCKCKEGFEEYEYHIWNDGTKQQRCYPGITLPWEDTLCGLDADCTGNFSEFFPSNSPHICKLTSKSGICSCQVGFIGLFSNARICRKKYLCSNLRDCKDFNGTTCVEKSCTYRFDIPCNETKFCPTLLGESYSICSLDKKCSCQIRTETGAEPGNYRHNVTDDSFYCEATTINDICYDDSECPSSLGLYCKKKKAESKGACSCMPYYRINATTGKSCYSAYGTCCSSVDDCGEPGEIPLACLHTNPRKCGLPNNSGIGNAFSDSDPC